MFSTKHFLQRNYYRIRTTTIRGLMQQWIKPAIQEKLLLWLLEYVYKYDTLALKQLQKAIVLMNFLQNHGISLHGKTVLDFGSGQSQNLMRLMILHGAEKAFTFDRYIDSGNDHLYLQNLKSWLRILDYSFKDDFENLKVTHISSLAEIKKESVHLIVSSSVLEHIAEPEKDIDALCNILLPGGKMVHFIDFADHDSSKPPLDFLRYDKETWDTMNPPNVFTHTNRYRLCDFEQLLRQKGMNVLFTEVTGNYTVSAKDRLCFHPYFQKYSERDLCTLNAIIIAQK